MVDWSYIRNKKSSNYHLSIAGALRIPFSLSLLIHGDFIGTIDTSPDGAVGACGQIEGEGEPVGGEYHQVYL